MMPLGLRRLSLFVAVCLIGVFFWKSSGDQWQFPQGLLIKQSPLQPSSGHAGPLLWKNVRPRHPVHAMIPLPSAIPISTIPKIQAIFTTESGSRKAWRLKRLNAVKEAMAHSWKGYTKYAWMKDEITPLTKKYKNPFGGWGATLVDSLDTLWIMGMEKEFVFAVSALEKIDFSRAGLESLNIFETTIRYLGGLLATHDLTDGKYPILLQKAIEIGDMLYVAFDTPDRMPVTRWNWREGYAGTDQRTGSTVLSAEIGSLTLEFTRLSQITGDPKYYDAVQRITDHLQAAQKRTSIPGLWPIIFNAYDLNFHKGNTFTLGGMADSLYEYIPKVGLFFPLQSPQMNLKTRRILLIGIYFNVCLRGV
jgi:mannosyl-oligosaccharide alpha-1,2-mannosidase